MSALKGRTCGSTITPRTLEYDIAGRSSRIHELLEEWRITASTVANTTNESHLGRNAELNAYFECLTQPWGWNMVRNRSRIVVEVRLNPALNSRDAADFAGADVVPLIETPLFNGEREILESMLDIISDLDDEGDRIELLRSSLQSTQADDGCGVRAKSVVLTSYSMVCREILLQLKNALGKSCGSRRISQRIVKEEVESELTRFRNNKDCFVLICDRLGEEGRNLQYADRVVHFDLPFAPNRIEQRIGRLDRIGRRTPISSTILFGH